MQEIQRHKITVEFCKNCKLHSWCTHHSQQKYKQAFDDCNCFVMQYPPQHYVPIKVKQNKYFDTESKKYVLFPAIGAFEIYFNEKLLFSKKTTNNWPNYEQIINQIVFLLTGQRRIPQNQDQHPQTEDSRISSKTVLYSNAKSSSTVPTNKKKSSTNQQQQNLELLYAEYETINDGTISKITKEDIDKLHGLWGKKDGLPNFIKNKAYIQETKGKKQMLVNLSSIEEESQLKQNQISAPNSQKKKLPNLQKDFDRLENKFKKLETRVSAVNNNRFDMESEYNSKQFSQSKSRTRDNLAKFSAHDKINESKISHSPQRMLKQMKDKKQKKIQKYINSTPEQKHEQLGIIYGAQYINYNLSSAQLSQRKNFNKLGNIKQSLEDFSQGCDEDSNTNTDIFAPLKKGDGGSFYSASYKQFSKTQNSFKPSVEKRKIYTREKLTSTPKDSQNEEFQIMRNKLKKVDQGQSALYHISNNKAHKDLGTGNRISQQKKNKVFNGKQTMHADSKKKSQLKKISQKNVGNNQKKDSLEETEKIYMAQCNQTYQKLSYHNSKSVSQSKGPKRKQFDAKNKNLSKITKNKSDSYSQGSNQQDSETEIKSNDRNSQSKQISNVNQNKSKYLINRQKLSQRSKTKMDASSKRDQQQFSKRSLNQSHATKKEYSFSKNPHTSFQKSDRSQDFNNQSQLTKKMSTAGANKSKSKNLTQNHQRLYSRSASLNHSLSVPKKLNEKNHGFSTDRKSNRSGYEKVSMKNSGKFGNEKILTDRSKLSSSQLKNKSSIHPSSSRSKVFEKNKSSLSLRSNKSKTKQISDRLKQGDPISQSPKSYKDELNHIEEIENKSEFIEEQDYEAQKNSRDVQKQMIQKQMNNIGTEAKPKRIYQIDEQTPDMVDVSTQKEDEQNERNKIGQGMQTSNMNEHRSSQIQKESESKQQDQGLDEINNIPHDSVLKQNKSKLNLPNEVSFNNQTNSQNNKSFSKPKSSQQSKTDIQYKKRTNIQYKSAAIVKQLYGQHYKTKAQQIEKLMKESFSHSKTEKRTCDLYGGKSNIFDLDSISFDKIVDVENKFGNIIKIIKILCMKNQYLIIRLFENPQIPDAPIFGVWLCENYNWKCFLIDSKIKSKQNKTPLYFAHEGQQLWPTILVEALLKKYQTIENLSSISISQLFHTLTGSNFINFRIKEDPQKNNKLLKFITANEKKNFIILAQKRMHHSLAESIEQDSENTVYLILSQKIINNKQVLLRMKKDNSDPFWIKFDKFVTQFSQIDILQLRINHNFNQLNLQQCGNGLFKVIELQFNDQSFGCVAFASENKQSNFKIHVYKQEDDNVLRLVGQVKEKNKSFTFFDCCFEEGKYLIFADMKSHNNRVSYMGEGFPLLNIKQEIKQIGLKNNYTEYIPIEAMPKRQELQMPRFLNMTKRSENDGIFGIESQANSQKMRIDKEKLKSQFIEYLTSN